MALQLTTSKKFIFLLNLGVLHFLHTGNSCLICQKIRQNKSFNENVSIFFFVFVFYWLVCLTGGLVYLPRVVIRTSYQTDTTKKQTSNMLFVASKNTTQQQQQSSLNDRYQCVFANKKKVQERRIKKKKWKLTHIYTWCTYTLMGSSKSIIKTKSGKTCCCGLICNSFLICYCCCYTIHIFHGYRVCVCVCVLCVWCYCCFHLYGFCCRFSKPVHRYFLFYIKKKK